MKEYNSGKLIFNYGVMNSAKSLNLIAKAYELKQRGFNIYCLSQLQITDILKHLLFLELDCQFLVSCFK